VFQAIVAVKSRFSVEGHWSAEIDFCRANLLFVPARWPLRAPLRILQS
jgi:hypothetical protein